MHPICDCAICTYKLGTQKLPSVPPLALRMVLYTINMMSPNSMVQVIVNLS